MRRATTTPSRAARAAARNSACANGRDVVLYGEPLFADVVAPSLGIALLQAPFDWLPGLPEHYRRRQVTFTTLAAAREYPQPAFIKPADDKCFPAAVYDSADRLPAPGPVPEWTPVLIAEPVSRRTPRGRPVFTAATLRRFSKWRARHRCRARG